MQKMAWNNKLSGGSKFLTSFSSKYYFLLAIMQQPAIRVQDTIREAA